MDKNKTFELSVDVFTVHCSESTSKRFDSKVFKKANDDLYANQHRFSIT